jgi:hypothetical protein
MIKISLKFPDKLDEYLLLSKGKFIISKRFFYWNYIGMGSQLSTYLQMTPEQIEEKKKSQNPAFLDHLLAKLHQHIQNK